MLNWATAVWKELPKRGSHRNPLRSGRCRAARRFAPECAGSRASRRQRPRKRRSPVRSKPGVPAGRRPAVWARPIAGGARNTNRMAPRKGRAGADAEAAGPIRPVNALRESTVRPSAVPTAVIFALRGEDLQIDHAEEERAVEDAEREFSHWLRPAHQLRRRMTGSSLGIKVYRIPSYVSSGASRARRRGRTRAVCRRSCGRGRSSRRDWIGSGRKANRRRRGCFPARPGA